MIDLYPNPLPPPPPPLTRESILTDVQKGFASLTDDELKLARLWLLGKTTEEACDRMRMDEENVTKLERCMRRKLRAGLEPQV